MMNDEVKVLDKGFVRLEAHMGGDAAVVRSARVSHGSEAGDPERDKKLIRYMLEHKHGTPFEHAVFTFHVKLPIFCARQWIRHRVSSYNEMSMRYREAKDEFYFPERWRLQDTKNKQGSVGADWTSTDHERVTRDLRAQAEQAMNLYRAMVASGVAREMARMALPVNLYTEWYWTVNARALMHFFELRSEQHAQWEMRQYSNALWPIFARAMPWTAEAFLGTLNLSRYQALDGVPGLNRAAIPSAMEASHGA
jgi:thymidylate synthase (FAD)